MSSCVSELFKREYFATFCSAWPTMNSHFKRGLPKILVLHLKNTHAHTLTREVGQLRCYGATRALTTPRMAHCGGRNGGERENEAATAKAASFTASPFCPHCLEWGATPLCVDAPRVVRPRARPTVPPPTHKSPLSLWFFKVIIDEFWGASSRIIYARTHARTH